MKYKRLFIQENLSISQIFCLSNKDQNYLFNVLRFKIGANFIVFNNLGEYLAEILSNDGKIKIISSIEKKVLAKELFLYFAIVKPQPLKIIFRQGVELGVTNYCPVITEYTNIKTLNIARYDAIINEALQQCSRLDKPKIESAISFDDFIKVADDVLIADKSGKSIFYYLAERKSYRGIFIGPEGGLSDSELKKINHLNLISMHQNILRADTAAIVGVSHLNLLYNME
ncbi:MAG: 16S rRNA (uracil(1498)-N(3))-methyltransferase [Anaplasmataceae bacterium]|nr:16S rRNA (uracil(1498)-N(3))-methyltransferase [Anaplasmataceae bacterium]